MSNEIFKDGRLKIGMSSSDPSSFRKDQLYTTGVPEPFKVEYYAFVENYERVEKDVHRKFNSKRPRKDREFFTCSVPEAIQTIRESAKIKYEEIFYKSPQEILKEENIRISRKQEENRLKQIEENNILQKQKEKKELEEYKAYQQKSNIDEWKEVVLGIFYMVLIGIVTLIFIKLV